MPTGWQAAHRRETRMHRTAVKQVVLEGVLDANDALAQANREKFDQAGTYVINLMSSPGAGKTAILERTLARLRGKLRLGVLEGGVQTTLDLDQFLGNLDAVNPGVERILTSARTSQGMDEWCSWLERRKPA